MFKFRYQIKRLRNMGHEWFRLTKIHLGRSDFYTSDKKLFYGIRSEWRMNSVSNEHLGRPYRIAMMQNSINPKYSSVMKDDDGNDIHIQRDIFDQIMDTIGGIIGLYWTNIFHHETCSHPHDKVRIEWEGEEEYGYYHQHQCNRCGGYLSEDEIDRYLPREDRSPLLIKGNLVNPMDRPRRGNDRYNDVDDSISQLEEERFDLDLMDQFYDDKDDLNDVVDGLNYYEASERAAKEGGL